MRRSSKFRRFLACKSFKKRLFSSQNLKIGHEIGTSLWSRWKRNRWRCSLEFYGSKTAKRISETWREKILELRLASTHLWRKQHDEVPVLHEFQKFLIVYSCYSRTHWRESDSAWFDGSRRYSFKWKEFLFHRGCSFYVTSILKSGLIAGGKDSKQGRQSSSHFSTRSETIQTNRRT